MENGAGLKICFLLKMGIFQAALLHPTFLNQPNFTDKTFPSFTPAGEPLGLVAQVLLLIAKRVQPVGFFAGKAPGNLPDLANAYKMMVSHGEGKTVSKSLTI